MKSWLKTLIIIFFLLIGLLIFLNTSKDNGIRTLTCYDRENISGKQGIKIPCMNDNDCNSSDEKIVAKMMEFCSPAEVGFYACGFRDFCGDDGYCMHDCSLGSLGK
jgi:hypothetical protein